MIVHCKPYKHFSYRNLLTVCTLLLSFLHISTGSLAEAADKPRIALLGDSMTWIGGDSCQNETGWSHYLKESSLASTIDVYARSGATWTNTKSTRHNPGHYSELLHDDNVLYNQAIRLIERADTSDATPDLIILFAGANDAWFKAKRPGLFDKATVSHNNPTCRQPNQATSLDGSIHLVCDMLQDRFPNATLLFVSPVQMSKIDAASIHRIADIIETTAKLRGWTTLRADNETCISHEQEAKSPRFTYDGVHTNPTGAKILGEYITQYIKSHLNTDN